MDTLKTLDFLGKVSSIYVYSRRNFSTEEIVQRINEIKYLTSQKKVPKLSLRKQIILLEDQLQGIFEVEKKILAQETREIAKIAALKKQIAGLRANLASRKDLDLQAKVSKLCHLLAECLAKKEMNEDIKLACKIEAELIKNKPPVPSLEKIEQEYRLAKINALEEKLALLRKELIRRRSRDQELIREERTDLHQVTLLEEKMAAIENKLKELYQNASGLKPRDAVNHTLMMEKQISGMDELPSEEGLIFHTPPPLKELIFHHQPPLEKQEKEYIFHEQPPVGLDAEKEYLFHDQPPYEDYEDYYKEPKQKIKPPLATKIKAEVKN